MENLFKNSSKKTQAIQKKTFTAWANSNLQKRKKSSPQINDLFKCLRNGHLLAKLLENLSGEPLEDLNPGKTGKQSVENVEICMDFLVDKSVSMRRIDPEKIVDGCSESTLKLMWAIITGLYINKKELLRKGENKTFEDALLLWAREKTKGYSRVHVKDFTGSSWKDGLAFLALIHVHGPNIVSLKDFDKDSRFNLKTAFRKADEEFGIPCLLDVEDVMKSQVDEVSVATYVACFYKRFPGFKNQRRSRESSNESKSDDGKNKRGLQATKSDGNRTERNRNRSTSRTGGQFRNKQKVRNDSQSSSRSSSTSSTSSDGKRGRKKSRGRSDKDRRRSRSPEGNRSNEKRRSNSNDDSCNFYKRSNPRKGTRNSRDRKRSSDSSHSRTKHRRDERSKSRDRKHISDRSLSRTRNRRGNRSCSREREHSSDRSPSKTRHRRERSSYIHEWKRNDRNSPNRRSKQNKEDMRRYEMSPDSIRRKDKSKERFYVRERMKNYSRGRNRSSSSSGHREKGRSYSRGRNRRSSSSDQRQRNRSYSRGRNRSSSRIYQVKNSPQSNFTRSYTMRPNSAKTLRGKPKNSNTRTLPGVFPEMEGKIQYARPHLDSTCSDDPMALINRLKSMVLLQPVPQTVRQKATSKLLPIQFEWQFQDEHKVWISYGKPNSSGNSSATTTSSDDIETHYMTNPTQPQLLIQSNQNHYLLNFQNMTQTNQTTSLQRPIRRILKQSPNIAPVNLSRSSTVGGIGNANFLHEWQFQDEHGSWITYGKPNSAGNMAHATTTCSDDIEKHYATNPVNPAPLAINSKSNAQYVLDFVSMTQTNQTTSVQRPIRRFLRQSATIMPFNASPSFNIGGIGIASIIYDWEFEDEHGSWITYGEPNSTGNAAHVTKTGSDDIEKHYTSNPTNPAPLTINSMNNVPYILDFKKLTQTNQQTSVQRKIRRMPRSSPWNAAAPKGSSFVWSFKDQHDNWIKYGETSSTNEGTYATSTTTVDIENKFSQNPTASFEISSGQHKYILDFNAMTQTNISTKAVRAIRRQLVTASDLPSNWKPMKTSDKGLLVVPLNKTDSEYTKQEAFVKKTLPSTNTITKIHRIQNENLWKDFVYKKNCLKARYPKTQFKEDYLFHGTDSKHRSAICEENFDFRLNGTNGTLYGKGTYFARSSAYSVNYCTGSPKVMFIVKVLVGRCTVGSTSDRRPPKDKSGNKYDTTVDNTSSPTIFVKYDNSEYYPEYYFEFT